MASLEGTKEKKLTWIQSYPIPIKKAQQPQYSVGKECMCVCVGGGGGVDTEESGKK